MSPVFPLEQACSGFLVFFFSLSIRYPSNFSPIAAFVSRFFLGRANGVSPICLRLLFPVAGVLLTVSAEKSDSVMTESAIADSVIIEADVAVEGDAG